MLEGLQANLNMIINYDDGRIAGREWVDNTRIRFVTERHYDEYGNLIREDFQRQRPREELIPFLSVYYHYISPEVLLEQLEQQQIVKVEP